MQSLTTIHNLPLTAAIAILYPLFFHRLSNNISGYNQVKNMCNDYTGGNTMKNMSFYEKRNTNEDSCWRDRERLMKNTELKHHYYMLFFGLAAVVGSLFLLRPGSTQTGIGWGGVFTILVSIVWNWKNYNEQQKLMVSGVALFTAVYSSSQFLNSFDSSNRFNRGDDTFYAVGT